MYINTLEANRLKHLLSLKELNQHDLNFIIQKGIEMKQKPQDFFLACERKGLSSHAFSKNFYTN